ncbi:succinoglycan biosynthesis protein exoA [alpha proteobacterium U9-1i]|nr:succinoglycan biosynthesis protein exoA [alpha proteobacterium U9-1i]
MSVLVVIPCLNEEAYLPGLLAQLSADDNVARIVVADGGSTDRSAEIVRRAAEADARIVLLHNPARIQSAGVNLAIKTHGGEAAFFVRVDAHAGYPSNFIATLLAAQSETNADSVTVSMRAVARLGACFQHAASAAQNSALGAGGSAHRSGGARRWVDHGHHALFRTSTFVGVGGYDERFSHNEDAELDLRIVQSGAKILLAADILIDYYPRKTPSALARQYFNFGHGRARTTRKHDVALKARQLAPAMIAPVIALAAFAPISVWFAAPMLSWLGLCLGYGAILGLRERNSCAAGAGIAAAIMHAAWSLGFIVGLTSARRDAVHSSANA